ncbi:MFS transporter [Mammaliicoccus fleurettii]|uniref:MFS transporter n=1 Tax=Mammaliicoccus fleurettii TaxID=150056 RepID=A0ABS5MLJ3_9STAP|nr:MFS transporter [Mammaliicoccus fleurettii]MBL0847027.1 MFS transporter [Mammaliicoccus fleurettii]MBS3671751.1 MFS transporter [Mammaliicoccus fleurettii]MBS3696751.1 MFS transporter [Mammaliicoccus fleurettii]
MSVSSSKKEQSPDKLPWFSLLAFSMASFICIMTETVPAGLLPQISEGLNVSNSYAGQLVTVYAIGSFVAAIPVTLATQSWRRKPLFLFAIGLFFVLNSVTALSSSYVVTLLARFIAGVGAGIVWSMLAGYARRLVPENLKGRATAIVFAGTPIALSIGVPLGSFLGSFIGWRGVFIIMSLLTLILITWIVVMIPDFSRSSKNTRVSLFSVLKIHGVLPILSVVLLWMISHNILYTYIAAFLGATGLEISVSTALLVFGILSIVGIWITGLFVDTHMRLLVLLSLSGFLLTALLLQFFDNNLILIFTGIILWGLTFGGAATLIQTALAQAVGEANVDVAMSISATSWNMAIAGGGFIGGILFDYIGTKSFSITIILFMIIAFFITFFNKKYAFPPNKYQSKSNHS